MAYNVGTVAKSALGRPLTHLPYNRFDRLDDTTWWLCPTEENPAYRHGKIAFTREFFFPETFIGFYIEKGIEQELAKIAYPGRRLGMDSTWLWPAFMADISSGEVDDVTRRVSERAERGVTVAIDGGTISNDPKYQTEFDFIRFEWLDDRLSCTEVASNELQSLNSGTSLQDLARKIQALPVLDSLWLDMQIGLAFSPDGSKEWSAANIWENLCAPWKTWIR